MKLRIRKAVFKYPLFSFRYIKANKDLLGLRCGNFILWIHYD